MLSIPLGPLALPAAPLLLVLSLWLASTVASRLASRRGSCSGRATEPAADRTGRGRTDGDPIGRVRTGHGDSGRDGSDGSDGSDVSDISDGTPTDGTRLAAIAGDACLHASLFGLAVARIVHLVLHADAYGADPWSMLDLRDGGWDTVSGTVAGLGWLAARGWRTQALAVPLTAGAITAATLWLLGSIALGRHDTPPLPDLMVTDLVTGRGMTLVEAAAGRPVVLNLWASWCGPCRQEMPVLAAAQRREPGIGFLFVNQGEAPAAVRAYLQREGLALDGVLLDAGSALGPAVGSRGLPTTLFHDAGGRRVDAHFGVINAAALEARLRALRPAR